MSATFPMVPHELLSPHHSCPAPLAAYGHILSVLTIIVILIFTEVLQKARALLAASSALEDHVWYGISDTAPDRKSEAVEGSGAHARITQL